MKKRLSLLVLLGLLSGCEGYVHKSGVEKLHIVQLAYPGSPVVALEDNGDQNSHHDYYIVRTPDNAVLLVEFHSDPDKVSEAELIPPKK